MVANISLKDATNIRAEHVFAVVVGEVGGDSANDGSGVDVEGVVPAVLISPLLGIGCINGHNGDGKEYKQSFHCFLLIGLWP